MLRSASRGDRARGVQRHVRGQGGEHAQALRPGSVAVTCSCAVSGTASTGRCASSALPGRGQVVDQPALLLELRAHDASRGRAASVVSSSSPLTAGRVAAVEQRAARSAAGRLAVCAGSAARPARTSSTSLHVALGERPLARRDLDHRGAGAATRDVARIESADAQRREQREREQDRGDRAAAARRRTA